MEEVANRLLILETKFSEKWDSHEKRSDERNKHLTNQFEEINLKIDVLMRRPCIEHGEAIATSIEARKSLSDRLNWAWGAIITMIVSIIGLFVKDVMGVK